MQNSQYPNKHHQLVILFLFYLYIYRSIILYAVFCKCSIILFYRRLKNMLQTLKGMIKYTDMFYSAQMLRYEDEQQYRTITGGLFSIVIIVTTIIGFASMIISTIELETITTSTQIIKSIDPTQSTFITSPQQNFMFAIQMWMVNMTGTQRFFDITLSNQIRNSQTLNITYLPLQPCTKEHWASIRSAQNAFDQSKVSNWLCPPIGQQFNIQGKYSSQFSSNYVLSVQPCKNETDPLRLCASQQKIDELFANLNQNIFFTFYYTKPIINPSLKQYKQYYFQDDCYIIFGTKIGSEAYIYFGDYNIQTDYSIWPFKNIVQDKGVFVQSVATNHPFQRTQHSSYINFYLAKSASTIIYNRQVQKISSVFSFIGGMISAFSALLFFIKIYTHLSYQISIALSVFKVKKQNQLNPKQLKMNFITFLKYHFYHICCKLGILLNWKSIKYMSQCQVQITKQLDVKSMIKRFIFIENCLTHLFQDFQNEGLQMKNSNSLQQVIQIRKKCELIINQEQSQISEEHSCKDNKIFNQIQSNTINLKASNSLQSNVKLCIFQQKRKRQKLSNIVVEDIANNDTKRNHDQKGALQPRKNTFLTNKKIILELKKKQIQNTNHLMLQNFKKYQDQQLSLTDQQRKKDVLNKLKSSSKLSQYHFK